MKYTLNNVYNDENYSVDDFHSIPVIPTRNVDMTRILLSLKHLIIEGHRICIFSDGHIRKGPGYHLKIPRVLVSHYIYFDGHYLYAVAVITRNRVKLKIAYDENGDMSDKTIEVLVAILTKKKYLGIRTIKL